MIIFFSISLFGLDDPEKIYQEECATCHEGGVTKAPHRMFLEMMPTDAIYSSLTEGIMASQAKNLDVESKKRLAEIIEPRMDEIFRLVKNEIRKSDYLGEYTFGIVLTGGGSELEHISDLAHEIFHQPIKIGKPHLRGGVSEKVNTPRYATGVGLINYGIENWKEEAYDQSGNIQAILKQSFNKMGSLIKNWY